MFLTRLRTPSLLSGLVFALFGMSTVVSYQYAKQYEHERIAHAFDELAMLKAQRVYLRIGGYAHTLLDLRGLFTSDSKVSESEFHRYLRGIEVDNRYPVLIRIGYSPRVSESNRGQVESQLGRLGLSHPKATVGEFPILYSYPAYGDLLGKNLNEGSLRGQALDRARDSNEPQISPQVQLRFQQDQRPGFVLYLALYGGEPAPADVETRRRELSGYLFAVFRTADLIESTIGADLKRQMGLVLFDGSTIAPLGLAYDSGVGLQASADPGATTYTSVQRIEVSGRPWTFMFVARPSFVQAHQSRLPIAVLLGGVLTSVFAAWLARAAAQRLLAEKKIRHLAFHDELTGLPNRAKLRLDLRAAILHEQQTKQPCALIIVELLRFSDINYTMGHLIGDEVLKQASARIREVASQQDLVARISNIQFGVLSPAANKDEAIDLARRLVSALEEPLPARKSKYELGARAGIVSVPIHGSDADELLRHADIALNLARTAGVAYSVYDARLDPYKPQRMALLGAFRQAVKDGQLQLYCQPKADLRTGHITSAEALVRWQHPEYGLLMPDQFIALIEPTELIQLLTEQMLDSAMRQAHAWRQSDLRLPLAVNLSARNLLNPALPELVGALMQTYGADTSWVELEITESSIMDDPVLSLRVLNQLHTMGFKLSIDDFGTGYSSLSYLIRLPVAVIKIDLSFASNMVRDPDAAAIVKSIIELGHNLGMKVIAEGVETEEIWDALARLGCDEAQGYYISPPIPAHTFRCWLERSNWRASWS